MPTNNAKKNFLVDLDLMNNQLLNGVIQNLSTAPSGKPAGAIYYNESDNKLYCFNGTTWISLMYVHSVTSATTITDQDKYVVSGVSVDSSGHVTGLTRKELNSAQLANILNDAATAASTTWSSTKIQNELTALENRVNSAAVGGLIYIGGYDGSTNTPALGSATPPAGIKKGHTYVATNATEGTSFFGQKLSSGDMLISLRDNPTSVSDWTVVNKNIPDILDATEAVKGVSQVATQAEATAGTNDSKFITALKMKAVVDAKIAANNTASSYSQLFGDGTLKTYPITHNLNTRNVDVTVIDEATGVRCEVEWSVSSVNAISVLVNIAPTTNKYRVTVRK